MTYYYPNGHISTGIWNTGQVRARVSEFFHRQLSASPMCSDIVTEPRSRSVWVDLILVRPRDVEAG